MLKQEIMQNRSEDLEYKKYIDNLQIIPTSATISITTESGSAMPVPIVNANFPIDTYGTMKYTVSIANSALLGENFIAEVKYIYSGTEYIYRFLFDIVKNKIVNILIDDDIENEYSKLKQLYRTIHGEITAVGALNEIIDVNNLNERLNYYKGSEVVFLSGDNKEWKSNITAFDEINRKLTLASNMPLVLSIGDKFYIRKNYTNEIQRAFEEICDWLRTRGYRPSLIIDDTQIREVHIACTLAKILHIEGESERTEYEDYRDKYFHLREQMKLLYDTDESGEPEESILTRPQVTFQR
jgi:hypothetical protein